ncbi:MAG: hypothetical protein OEZ48_00280 [Candidatus Bathyarchaeota archaeon]|nr:hypothetical protein [Candidatus Bathyarchaeota archaeon]MDH5686293.1 hypothetical protein [Candidatus Bathyarchaeota archaeon]
MAETKIEICPACGVNLEPDLEDSSELECPKCGYGYREDQRLSRAGYGWIEGFKRKRKQGKRKCVEVGGYWRKRRSSHAR